MAGKKKERSISISIKYRINGSLFRLHWPISEHAAARARIEVLREMGIAVAVRGWPKVIKTAVSPIAKK